MAKGPDKSNAGANRDSRFWPYISDNLNVRRILDALGYSSYVLGSDDGFTTEGPALLPSSVGVTSTYVLQADGQWVANAGGGGGGGITQLTGDVTTPASSSGSTVATIANAAVESAMIKDAAVTFVKIADGNVTNAKLQDNSVSTTKILDDVITTAKVIDSQITYAKMQDVSAASRLLGSGSSGGSAAPAELTVSNGISISGTVVSAPGIATNTTAIAANATNITAVVAVNDAQWIVISANTTLANANAAAITSNDTDIAANTAAIASNDTDIAANTAAIASNDTDIAANTAAISSNDTDIAANTAAIASNDTDIAANTSAISTNTSAISTNTSNISTNTSNISTNTTNIAKRIMRLCFHADATANVSMVNFASDQFLSNNNRNIQLVDLSAYTHVRLSHRTVTKSVSVDNPRLVLRYVTSYTQTVGSYINMGLGDSPAEVSSTLGGWNIQTSGWVELNSAARVDDLYLAVIQTGGDSNTARAASVMAEFK